MKETQTIDVRTETPQDIATIRHVVARAFGRSNEAALVDRLRVANKVTISLVAVYEEQLVGHILFSPVAVVPSPNGFSGVGLAPVAVLPQFQKRGIGSRLIQEGILACKRAGHDMAVVYGNPRLYSRYGFSPVSDYGLSGEGNDAYFMAMEFRGGALSEVKGSLIKYQSEFQTL